MNAAKVGKLVLAVFFLAMFSGLVGICGRPAVAQEDDPLVEMVIGLLRDPELEMRALGFQQVREGEEVKGEAATRKFAAVLPELPPESQAGLLEALGERRDPVARPDVLNMLESKEEKVRAAALKALGFLGTDEDVALLADKAAEGTAAEKSAARESLVRLQFEGANDAIVKTLEQGSPAVRVELLGALAGRNARSELPTVYECVEDSEASVRVAALEALRLLADESQAAKLVEIVKAAGSDLERRKAELALLVLCSRSGQACLEAVLAGLDGAEGPSRAALLRAAARVGGPEALETVAAHVNHSDEAVSDEAVRRLSIWSDPAVLPELKALAEQKDNQRHHVLAIRGMVRLASAVEDKPADVDTLAQALELAQRPAEKRLVLGALGGAAQAKAATLAAALLDDPSLCEEAALAVVRVAEKAEGSDAQTLRPLLEKVQSKSKSQEVRSRAKKALDAL